MSATPSYSENPESKTHSPWTTERLILVGVIAAYLVLAVAAALTVPAVGDADPRLTPPDESAHWLYVKQLALEHRLPIFSKGSGDYEAHQPPLYYLSCLWCYAIGGENGITIGRLWSVLLGALTLLVGWQVFGLLLGNRLWPRTVALAALAFIPGRLFIIASVSNDAMFELCAAAVLLACLRVTRAGASTTRSAALGACLALALLTKTTGILLAPVVGLAVVLEPRWRQHGARKLLLNAAIIAAIVACLWGPWVVRNLAVYGEPLAMETFREVFLKDRATPDYFLQRGLPYPYYWLLVAQQTWLSLWGVFGQATVYMPAAFYKLGNVLAALAAIGLFAQFARSRGEPAKRAIGPAWLLAGTLLVMTVAGFLRFNSVFYQAQARYLFPASIVLAALLGKGICGLTDNSKVVPWLGVAAMIGLAAMSAWAVAAYMTGGYSLTPPGLG